MNKVASIALFRTLVKSVYNIYTLSVHQMQTTNV